MKIHFASSAVKIKENKELYLKIREMILDLGHDFVNDWIDKAVKEKDTNAREDSREKKFIKIIKSVEACDVLVAEGTVESFSVGYQMTVAIQQEKPILFLFQGSHKNKIPMREKMDFMFKSPYIMSASYTVDNLESILKKFFKLYKSGGKFRFNMFLDKSTRAYLNWTSSQTGVNKSDLIRSYILEKAKDDKKYIQHNKMLGIKVVI